MTWHDACHVTKSPRLSLRLSLGRVKGHTHGIIARKEGEPGNVWGVISAKIQVNNFVSVPELI